MDILKNINMKLEIKHQGSTTALYDGAIKVCEFVTDSREINLKYAKEIVKKVSGLENKGETFYCSDKEDGKYKCINQCLECKDTVDGL